MRTRLKFDSYTSVEGGRTTLDLPYLEEQHFHIERVVDYVTPSLPLFNIHQARTVLLFFYAISLSIIYCFIPHLIEGSPSIISDFVIFFPLICVTLFHIFLSAGYILFVLFTGSSFKTLIGIHYYLHTTFPIVIFSLLIVNFAREVSDPFFMFLVGLSSSFFLDFIFGVISVPNLRVFLLFEGICAFPSLLLWSLYEKNIFIPSFIFIFVPFLAFYVVYFSLLLGLFKFMPKCCHKISARFFADESILAEYKAADDYQSYWNSALWRDDGVRVRERDTSDSDSTENFDEKSDEPSASTILTSSATKKKDFRFPRKERFQLYKLDEVPQYPFYICSPAPIVLTSALVILAFVNSFKVIPGFLLIFGGGIVVVAVSIIINSRAISWNCFSITNLGKDTINILWDHPSLSMI